MTNVNRVLMEQFGDVMGDVPQPEEQESPRAVTAQEKIMQDMGDVVLEDLSRDIMQSLKSIEVIDNYGREYKVKVQNTETVSYAIEGNNSILRIYINS